jgi:phage terminase large subunit-like protein
MAVLQKQIPLWQRWSADALKSKRDIVGSRDFDRGWRQIALSEDELTFRPEHVDRCVSKSNILHFPIAGASKKDFCPPGHYSFMGVDLAIASKSAGGDFFVIVGIIVDAKTGHRTVVSIYRQRGLTFDQQLKVVEMYADFLDPTFVYVENNAYQQAFVQELQRRTALPVEPFTTTAVKKSDLDYGLPRMALEIEQQKWTFPMGNAVSIDLTSILLSELKTFPISRHDDCLMALWFARCAAAHIEKRVEKNIYVL